MVWGLVEITFGPVHASNSLPEWQAVKLTFFAPWSNLLTFTNTSKTWILFSHFCVFSTVNFWHPLLCTLQRYLKSPVHKKHVRRLTCLSLTVPVPLTLIKKIQIASNPSASWALRNLKFCLNTAWWGNLNKTSQIKVRHEYNIIIMSCVHDVVYSAFAKLLLGYKAFLFLIATSTLQGLVQTPNFSWAKPNSN